MYPVYAHGSVLGCRPLFMVNKPEKLWMLAEGSAESISRGKALRLRLNILELRGASCQMGPAVMMRAIEGRPEAMAAAASYRFAL